MHHYPLLQRVSELYANTELGNVLLLASQHLLEPQLRMFEHLINLGLKPENCVIVGKNYSTNDEIVSELIELGCVVAPFSNEFDPFQTFDTWFAEKTTSFIKAEISRRPMSAYDKVLVLDDGGFMHIVLNELCPDLDNIVGVEQTSSGHHRIKDACVRFPVISVARSYHKLVYESPYIGKNGEWRILHRLATKKKPRALVFGLGPIGRQIAGKLLLLGEINGCVVDTKFEMFRWKSGSDPAPKGIFDLFKPGHILRPEEVKSRLCEFDLIIGNTGTKVLAEEDVELLHPKAMLISMSSSDREFPALPFRKCGGSVHDDYEIHGRVLVNGGFPITFDGKRHGMPPAQIELTIALLMIHLVDAVDGTQQHLPSVVNQIHSLWQPDKGASEWYETHNRPD